MIPAKLPRSYGLGYDLRANTLTPSTTAASRAFAPAQQSHFQSSFTRPPRAAEKARPRRPERRHPVESSREGHTRSAFAKKNWPPYTPPNPSAIGKSNPDPSLRTSAGARLMVTPCPYGNSNPQSQRRLNALPRLSFTHCRQTHYVKVLHYGPEPTFDFDFDDVGHQFHTRKR